MRPVANAGDRFSACTVKAWGSQATHDVVSQSRRESSFTMRAEECEAVGVDRQFG